MQVPSCHMDTRYGQHLLTWYNKFFLDLLRQHNILQFLVICEEHMNVLLESWLISLNAWMLTQGETANSIQLPERRCNSQDHGKLCDERTCFSCNSIREAESQIVRGTLLVRQQIWYILWGKHNYCIDYYFWISNANQYNNTS